MTSKHILIAKILFIMSALCGLAVSAALGYIFSDSFSVNGITISLIGAALVIAFHYCAYLGLIQQSFGMAIIFWIYIVLNLFSIPIGTIFSITLIYFWNQQRKPHSSPI
ncbi:hypothetical protein [Aeromonas jandaei]|uniref:hypothetical protein n=1 Tax=Aeromonas jandaei TaxID=650 RepID=UPI003985C876